jgi:hypothetical protein
MEQVRIERLDHLGLIASVIKDLGLIASKVSANPWPPAKNPAHSR